MRHRYNERFVDEEIVLDNTRWESCVFERCTLIATVNTYEMVFCHLTDSPIEYRGEATEPEVIWEWERQ